MGVQDTAKLHEMHQDFLVYWKLFSYVIYVEGPLARFRRCNTVEKIILFKNLLDSQGKHRVNVSLRGQEIS